ncbi:MAG: DUF2007 domain-containing protein [Pseudomonadota bacterium]
MFKERDEPRRIYSADTLTQVVLVQNVLTAAGIETELRNEHLGSVVGELPPISVWPELWVVDDRDLTRAKALVDDFLAPDQVEGPGWRCKRCGADNEAQFALCWNCGAAVDG